MTQAQQDHLAVPEAEIRYYLDHLQTMEQLEQQLTVIDSASSDAAHTADIDAEIVALRESILAAQEELAVLTRMTTMLESKRHLFFQLREAAAGGEP